MALYVYHHTDILLRFSFQKYIDPGNVTTNNIIVDVVRRASYANDVMAILHNGC